MKNLKFADHLVELVLSGDKTTTWRAFDDKNLSMGDKLNLLRASTMESFGKAVIVDVVEKPLADLRAKDISDHEKFESVKVMYATFGQYYKRPVTPETTIKVIKFELLK